MKEQVQELVKKVYEQYHVDDAALERWVRIHHHVYSDAQAGIMEMNGDRISSDGDKSYPRLDQATCDLLRDITQPLSIGESARYGLGTLHSAHATMVTVGVTSDYKGEGRALWVTVISMLRDNQD